MKYWLLKNTHKAVARNLVPILLTVMTLLSSVAGYGQSVPITALAVVPDGQFLSGSDHGLQLHSATTLKVVKRIDSELEKIYAIRLSPDRKKIAVSGGTPAEFGSVEVFSTSTWEKTHSFEPFVDIATDFSWLSNDRLIAASMTGECCMISLTQRPTEPFPVHSKGILTMVRLNSNLLVTAGLDETIGVWDLERRKMLRTLNNHVDIINGLALRPNGTGDGLNTPAMVVTVSDDATVRFWQPAIGRMVRFARLESIPTCVLWNHGGTRAIVGTRSGKIHFVDPVTAKVDRTIEGTEWVNCLALPIADTSLLVGGVDGLRRVTIPEK